MVAASKKVLPVAGSAGVNVAFVKALGKLRQCSNCYRLLSSQDSLRCGRCGQIYYCSKACQVKDWKPHRRKVCPLLTEQSASRDDRKHSVSRMRQKWLKRVQGVIPHLISLCLTQEQFEQQPPAYELVLCVQFNYNYGTYIPVARPVVVYRDPEHIQKVYPMPVAANLEETILRMQKKKESKWHKTHIIRIIFETLSEVMVCNVEYESSMGACRNMGWAIDQYTHEDIVRSLVSIELPKSVFNPKSYNPMCERNLKYHLEFMQKATDEQKKDKIWDRFLVNAFRCNEWTNLRGTHVLCVYFVWDALPGSIFRVTRYEMITLVTAQQRLPWAIARTYLALNDPSALPALLMEERRGDLFAITGYAPMELPPGFQYWTLEESSEVATYFFDQLQALEFPMSSLEIPMPVG